MDSDHEDDEQEENQEEDQEEEEPQEEEVLEESVIEDEPEEEEDAGEGNEDYEKNVVKEPQKLTELADQQKKKNLVMGQKLTENAQRDKMQEDDGHQYDYIRDPSVRALMSVNLETGNRDDILNMLLSNSSLAPKPKAEEIPQKPERKIPRQFQNVESHYKNIQMKKDSDTEPKFNKTGYFHIFAEKNNPEFTNDFGTAVKKLFCKLTKESPQPNDEIMKILISDKEKLDSEIAKLDIVKPSYIDQKVKMNLKRKQENLQNIEAKLKQDFMEKHTFTPVLQTTDPTNTKRSFEQFIHDQTNHTKKIKSRILSMQEDDKKKQDEIISKMHPKIDVNSEKIVSTSLKINEPVFQRLFHRKYVTAKKELLKSVPEESKKEAVLHTEPNMRTNLITKAKVKKKKVKKNSQVQAQDQDQEKRIMKKETKEKIEGEPIRQKASSADKKSTKKKEVGEKQPIMTEDRIASNKIILARLMVKYKQVIGSVYELNQREVHGGVNKLTLQQMNEVFNKMGYISKPETKEGIYKTTASNKITGESILQQLEQKLINDAWEALKDSENLVNPDSLFLLILCIHNLYAYYLYSSFKVSHSKVEIAAIFPSETKREQKISMILSQMAEEIAKKIQHTNKYTCSDQNGVILIPLDKAKLIKQDFNLFYITYMNSEKSVHAKAKQDNKKEQNSLFTPLINQESARIYANYRKKVMEAEAENGPKWKGHLEYMEKLNMKKKRRELENARMKEEQSKKEVKDCTFRPHIPKEKLASTSTREGKTDCNEELFQKGKHKLLNRKDKTRDEFDIEKYGKECTFKPDISGTVTIPPTRFRNDIYNEKSYELLYSRLKKGRMDRLIKEAVHDRFDFDDALKDYFMKNKSKDSIEIVTPKEVTEQQTTTSIDNTTIPKAKDPEVQTQMTNEIQPVVAEKSKSSQSPNNPPEPSPDREVMKGDMEKKDAIPLLIIDVNIRPGVKKKIYVFEGDTAEGLAEKFSTEHNLDAETKGKLQVLIQNHMLRLLTRIDEENQSISEKSSTYNLS